MGDGGGGDAVEVLQTGGGNDTSRIGGVAGCGGDATLADFIPRPRRRQTRIRGDECGGGVEHVYVPD